MEAFLLGKEVISVIPKNSEIDWAPPELIDNVNCVYNLKDLKKSIDKVIIKKEGLQRKKILKQKPSKETILRFINKILQS